MSYAIFPCRSVHESSAKQFKLAEDVRLISKERQRLRIACEKLMSSAHEDLNLAPSQLKPNKQFPKSPKKTRDRIRRAQSASVAPAITSRSNGRRDQLSLASSDSEFSIENERATGKRPLLAPKTQPRLAAKARSVKRDILDSSDEEVDDISEDNTQSPVDSLPETHQADASPAMKKLMSRAKQQRSNQFPGTYSDYLQLRAEHSRINND